MPGSTVTIVENEPSGATSTALPCTVTRTPSPSSRTMPLTMMVAASLKVPRCGDVSSTVGGRSSASSDPEQPRRLPAIAMETMALMPVETAAGVPVLPHRNLACCLAGSSNCQGFGPKVRAHARGHGCGYGPAATAVPVTSIEAKTLGYAKTHSFAVAGPGSVGENSSSTLQVLAGPISASWQS